MKVLYKDYIEWQDQNSSLLSSEYCDPFAIQVKRKESVAQDIVNWPKWVVNRYCPDGSSGYFFLFFLDIHSFYI